MALATPSRQVVWYLNACTQLGYAITMMIISDDTSCINVTENSINNLRTQDIDVAYHFTNQNLMCKFFARSYILSNNNTADYMTKRLQPVAHNVHSERLNSSE